jgi:predicted nucleotidyltransferase
MSTIAHERAETARTISQRLAKIPFVEGICLFGSLARGDTDEWSDIDLLVVGDSEQLRPTALLRSLPDRLRTERLSLVCYSPEELRSLFEMGSSFIDHIRQEGKPLYDRNGLLTHILKDSFEPKLNVAEELSTELKRLEIYDDLSLFKGNFLFCLAQLYAIGKSVAILGVLAGGDREYARDRAFEAAKLIYPERATEIEKISRLRPFYRRVTRRQPEPLPFHYRGADEEVRDAVSAVRALASAIE